MRFDRFYLPIFVLFSTVLVGGLHAAPPDPPIAMEDYELVFADEFEGRAIDWGKWEHRHLGPWAAKKRTAVEDAAYLDGQGHLVLAWASRRWADPENRPYGTEFERLYANLKSKQEWKYGYYEMRVKLPDVKGAGFAWWMRSRNLTQADAPDAATYGAEIDLIEQTFWGRHGKPEDWKTTTVHWGGYKEHHRAAGFIVKKPDFRDGQWHTVSMLWTPDYYRFFYDRQPVGNLTKGVSHQPQHIIMHMRQFASHLVKGVGWGDLEETDGKVKIDWIRIHQIKEGLDYPRYSESELLYENLRLAADSVSRYKWRQTRTELENRD